jgi:predicted small metal-binding protein
MWVPAGVGWQEGRTMARKVADCRLHPDKFNCTLVLAGEEEEVVRAAAEHAASVHGYPSTPEVKAQIRSMLKTEGA